MEYKTLSKDMKEYPNHLKMISDAPELLYYIGNISLIQSPLVAMVGTRRASSYGKWVTGEIAKRIASCGIPIVSGMAYGIDTCAHKACLKVGTPTVAVLGTGIDIPYPASNRELYYEIAEKGLILSELPPGVPGMKYSFPLRNRIISGLSSKVVVCEGACKSGSMITARLALAQGRDVFAVPGNINQFGSTGVNSLIFDGATPIISLDEVLEVMGIQGDQISLAIINASKEELELLSIIKENPGISADELSFLCKREISRVLTLVCGMELKSLIRSDGKSLFYS